MSKNIRGITITIDAETTGLSKALGDVNKASRDIQGELRQVNRLLKFNPKNVELLTQKKKLLSEQVEVTSEKLKRLKAAEKEVQEQFEKGEITEEQYRAFQREIVETESKLKHYQKQLKEVNKYHTELGLKLEEAGEKMQTMGKKISDVGGDLTKKITLPLAGIGGAAAKLGIDFERSMSEVAAVTGSTGDELKELEETARHVGKTTNKSASEAAEGLKLMGQAGWDVAESQMALEPLVKLSTSGNIDLAKATDLLVNGLATMGKTSEDTERYLDVLAKTANSVNTDIDGLGEAFISVGGRFNTLGVDIEEGAKSLGVLAEAGITGSEAGKALNAVLANLTAPTGRAKQALDELNVSAFDSQGEFIGIEETLKLVEGAMEGMDTEQKNMYMSMIAGKEHTDAFTGLMSGLGGTFDKLTDEIGNSDGALDEMYNTITGDTKGSIEDLKSSLEELMLTIYDGLQPTIEKLVEWVQKITDKFNSLSPETQDNIIKIGLLVAAIGPLLMIFGTLFEKTGTVIRVGGKLIGNWDKIKGAGSLLAGGLKATVGFIFSPAGAILIGIAAAIAIGVALYKNWDKIKEKANSLKTSISATFKQIKTAISKPIEDARDAVDKAVEAIKGFFKNMKLKLPKIELPKLPKFTLKGEFGWKPPRVPKIGIEWNKEGAIFTKPYVFGNQGWGEAGPEAVLPIEKLGGILADTLKRMNYDPYQNAGHNKGNDSRFKNREITQNITINSPKELTPSETARQVKNASRNLAMEW